MIPLVQRTAQEHELDWVLVAAIIEQESGWNPWAMRYEPAFFAKYVAPLYTNNKISASEAWARAFSWGAMQVIGQVAREAGFNGRFLSELCDPVTGIAIGCKILKAKMVRTGNEETAGLLAWNGGGNPHYAVEVLARKHTYAP